MEGLLKQLSEVNGQPFPPRINDAFGKLAQERRDRDPARFWLWLPLKRVVAMWANPYTSIGWPAASELKAGIPAEDMQNLLEGGVQGAFALVLKYPVLAAYKGMTAGYRWALVVLCLGLLALTWGKALGAARTVLWLAMAYAFTRSVFYSFFFANSTRYIVEAVPGLELAAVVCLAILWRRHRTAVPIDAVAGYGTSV